MRTQAPHIVEGFALLLLASTLPAAADGPAPVDPYGYTPPPVVSEYNWSGIYLGGHVGAGTAAFKWEFSNPSDSLGQHSFGAEGGVQIGVQKQWNTLLLGAEFSYTGIDLSASSNSGAVPGTSRSVELSNLLILAGRLGVTWQNYLAYTKVGYASADIDFRSNETASGVSLTSSSAREQGWVAGLGIEYGIRPDINIGVEYDYVHLNAGVREQIATPIGVPGSRAGGSVELQSVLARVNYKFAPGWLEPAPFR